MKEAETGLNGGHPFLKQYLSLKELSGLLGMDRSTVRRQMQRLGVSVLKIGASIRYPKDEVDAVLGNHMQPEDAE